MNVKLDIKTIIGLCAVIVTLAGFYYTTQLRLDRLEVAIEQKQSDGELKALKKQLHKLNKRVKALEEK